MNKQEISGILDEVASLLELKKESTFKVRAYRQAAETISTLTSDVGTLIENKQLVELKGIGPSISEKIEEIYSSGSLSYLNELKKTIPEGLPDMLRIPGLGPRKVIALYEKLGIKNLESLESACKSNKLAGIEGFGEKTQNNILKGIEYIKKSSDRHLLDFANSKADALFEYLKKNKDFTRISLAGSIRRHNETVKDIDIVSSGRNPAQLMEYFTRFPETGDIIAKGETKTSVRLKSGINTDIRIVDNDVFPFALHHFTGSKEHNTAMRSRAKTMGMKMNEYGLFKSDKLIKCKNEEEIFKALKLSYIPPELRENHGEIEAAEKNMIPKLINRNDLKGALHVHTNYSDGKDTLETVITAAIEGKLEYIGICDHSQSAHYAGGLKEKDINSQHEEINKLQKKYKNILILKGIESDIRHDGSLDYPERILEKFDFIIGAIHSNFAMTEEGMTGRIIKALKNPFLTMLAHPTGRMLLTREGYKVNITEIINTASQYNKIIELNSNPNRYDLDWRYLKYAKEKNVLISINPDAHSAAQIYDMYSGTGIARKGWLEAENVANTRPAKKIKETLKGAGK